MAGFSLNRGMESRPVGKAAAADLPAAAVQDSTGKGTAAFSVLREAPLNVMDPKYGAVGDGTTDDSAAFAAVATALPSAGGEVYLPMPSSSFNLGTTGWNLQNKRVIVRAAGAEFGGCKLTYSGTGRMIDARGLSGANNGCVFEGLTLDSTTAAFLLDLGNTSGNATDSGSTGSKIDRVQFFGGAGGTPTLLRLSQSAVTQVVGCAFNGGAIGILGVDQANAFANTIQIENCWFEYQATIPIKNPGQNWLVKGNTFEPLNGGNAGAVATDATVNSSGIAGVYGFTYIGNSHQDSSSGSTGAWVQLRGNGISIIGNEFFGNCGACIDLSAAACKGLAILGNMIGNANSASGVGVKFNGSEVDTMMLGNWFVSNTTNYSPTPGGQSMIQTFGGQSLNGATTHTGTLGLFGAAAVAQPATTGTVAGFTAGAGTAMNSASTSTGGSGATAYTFGDVVLALKQIGALKS